MQIFVLGTGRSGTHWIGHILDEHPGIRSTIEKRPIFPLATRAAIQPRTRPFVLPVLKIAYRYEIKKSLPRHYADKSHPIVWFADVVADWFPESRFVGIQRDPFATVSSMLLHSGVSAWQRNWKRYGVPNEFLGIDATNAASYDSLSEAQKAALRWKAHHDRLEGLKQILGSRLLVLSYETFSLDFERSLGIMWDFLNLPPIASIHEPKTTSLHDWRSRLSAEQVADISQITGLQPT